MPRPRVHADDAARHLAYRKRRKATVSSLQAEVTRLRSQVSFMAAEHGLVLHLQQFGIHDSPDLCAAMAAKENVC